ncbi:small ubiquitin-related modifier-like [Varroa jacobsoni]|uniref:Ubiquitin-like domain-containing protein n=1 Tax=Varroa destructor TaxID=109461 RepID=A0A7M7JQ56_VARDE|nr:small ubiquitin-related modifier-like [Varroa destructor]XP_022691828.1 small ubiquitin-related modifier-like [Varroa jacobsoni]
MSSDPAAERPGPSNSSADAKEFIKLKVKGQEGDEIHFRLKMTTPFSKIKKNYAERVGVAAGSVRLIFDGSPVSDTDTPRGLSLEDDDVIEAFVEQTGGSSSYSTASACSSTNRCFNRIPQSRARRWSTRILESSFEQRSAPICSNAHNLDQRRRI